MNYFKISKFLLFLVPLTVIFVTPTTLFPFIVWKYVWFRTTVDVALIFFLLGLLFRDNSSAVGQRLLALFRRPIVIATSAFAGIFLLAGFFGVDPSFSFWSSFERGEGGFQILHLWIFFVLLVTLFEEERDWRRLFGWAIVGGVLSGLYGLLAGWGFSGFIGPRFGESGFRFFGSIGNPAYVAAYSIFLVFYVLYLLSAAYRRRLASAGAIALFIAGIGFLTMFFAAATRGAFIGLIVAVAASLLYFMYAHASMRKWLLVVIAVLTIGIGSFIYFKDAPFVKSIPGSRIFDISFSARTFEDRAIMWKIAWDGFKERPLLGWGPENYLKVFDSHFNTRYFRPGEGFGAWFDRAHSIYFDYLAETGILGLLSFLSIFAVFYWRLFRVARAGAENPSSFVSALLFGLSLAYLVQGIVLFDVLVIYLNVFIFISFATYLFSRPIPK